MLTSETGRPTPGGPITELAAASSASAEGTPRRRRARRAYPGDVSHGAWTTYQVIAAHRPLRDGSRQVRRATLAAQMGRSPRQVGKYLAELRRAGYVEVVAPPARRARLGNRYRLS